MARKKSASADTTDTPDTPRRSSPAALIIASLALTLALLAGGVAVWSNLQLQAVQGLSQRVSGDQTLLQNLTRRVDRLSEDGLEISRGFEFQAYGRTLAFANAVAWIAISEGHHPVLTISYGRCDVSYTTHAIDGLSDNDFICAAKIDRLARESAA